MKAKIIIYIDGNERAIENMYEAIIHNKTVLNKNSYWVEENGIPYNYKTIEAICYRTILEKGVKANGS